MAEKGSDSSQRIAVTLATDLVEQIDRLKEQLGLRSRGRVLEQLLEELLSVEPEGEESEGATPFLEEGTAPAPSGRGEIDEQAALVLVGRGSLEAPPAALAEEQESAESYGTSPRGGVLMLSIATKTVRRCHKNGSQLHECRQCLWRLCSNPKALLSS